MNFCRMTKQMEPLDKTPLRSWKKLLTMWLTAKNLNQCKVNVSSLADSLGMASILSFQFC